MKVFVALLRAGLLLPALWACLSLCAPLGALAGVKGPYYIQASEVNLRSEPQGAVLEVLDRGAKVFVMEERDGWSHVSVPLLEKKGWVYSEYLGRKHASEPDPSAEQSEAPKAAAEEKAVTADPTVTEVVIADVCVKPDAELQSEGDAADGATGGTQTLQVESFGLDPEKDSPAAKKSASRNASSLAAPGDDPSAALIPPPAKEKPIAPPSLANKNIDITTPKELASAAYKPVGGLDMALIGGTDVNVRAEASKQSKSLCKVGSGDKVYIIGADEPWYYVSVPEKKLKGYIHSDFVDALPRLEIKGDDVRLREGPSTEAKIKTELDKGEVFCKLAQKNGWVKVASSASGVNGWVKAEYVKKTEKTLSRSFDVIGDAVNFRASPSVDAEVISQLPSGAKVQVFGRNEKWTYLAFGAQKGWMYSQYLAPSGGKAERARDAQLMAHNKDYSRPSWKKVGGSSIGNRLIDGAMAMKGTPYVWGGESDNGVDCSGLIYKLLTDNGADTKCLPRRASEQMAQIGLAVDKEELEPGDLVFFSTYKPGPSHVGIYLGDGDFIHASSAQHQVAISNLSEGYYKKRFCGARRITEEELEKLQ